jgi:hypothetical protein
MEKCLKSVSREGARRMEIRLKDYTNDFARLKKDLQHATLVTSSYERDFQNSKNQVNLVTLAALPQSSHIFSLGGITEWM